VGPHTWKRYLFPPRVRLWKAARGEGGFDVTRENGAAPKYAFLGVRSCELTAIGLQDRVFLDGSHVDPTYRSRRADAFFIAVQCGSAGGTCFCSSMGTGPRADRGFDLALTELVGEGRHDFVVEIGSERGREMVAPLGLPASTARDQEAALAATRNAEKSMGRSMEAPGVPDLLHRNVDHPRWRETSHRCLACGNCTMVCPTCFCTTVEDHTNLAGTEAERWRHWDSCFSTEFSFIHGGHVRQSRKSRYRQWITHKLASWHDQFDRSGCVGCGRCITWCPVGIDITEEVAAVREAELAMASATEG
jgi:ferredoxin